ncbi:branched-chain amino acid aminotransferase [bacterium]|nr:MAG: branched-chain amino acid aminotransferase [bacterium]
MNLEIQKITADKKKTKPVFDSSLGFGKYFSDHFFIMKYDAKNGWHQAKIEPYRQLMLDPAAMVLHYAQEIFEGLKAYNSKNGIFLFRAKDNLKRMNNSARRLCMPEIDIDFVHDAMKKLVLIDKEWIPSARETSMYIRPTMIATEASVGVRVSGEYLFYIIVGPAGSYYPEGFNPIKIFVSDKYVRAVRGGVGEAKTGANYAASLFAAQEAKKMGCSQVLWLDAIDQKHVEEVGTTNIFFRFDDEVVTSPLTGTILPGITRDSVIKLLKSWNMKCTERRISIDEIMEGSKNGKLKEVFGTGTAAVISPVSELHYKDEVFNVGGGKIGDISLKLYNEILSIQYGEKTDPFGWVEKIG